MSTRNIVWLAAVVVVGVVVGVAVNWWSGLIAACVVLVVSETVERRARRKRQLAVGSAVGSPLRRTLANRRRP